MDLYRLAQIPALSSISQFPGLIKFVIDEFLCGSRHNNKPFRLGMWNVGILISRSSLATNGQPTTRFSL